jgi:hypothetical protein
MKRGGVIGGDRWGSMAWEMEGTTSMVQWPEGSRRWRSTGVVREEERPGGLRAPKG